MINTVLDKYENVCQGKSVERNAMDRVVTNDVKRTSVKQDTKIANLIDFDIIEDAPVANPISFDLFSAPGGYQAPNFGNSPQGFGMQNNNYKNAPATTTAPNMANMPLMGLGVQSAPNPFDNIQPQQLTKQQNASNQTDPFGNIDIFSSPSMSSKQTAQLAAASLPPLQKESKTECMKNTSIF